jgi:hypothetical protein
MPARGYRKGLSDNKTPAPRRIHTRLANEIYARLMADAAGRSLPASRIIRAIVTGFYTGRRPELPQDKGASHAAIRQLARIGNNLNQIAREAHLMRLHLLEARATATIERINAAIARL